MRRTAIVIGLSVLAACAQMSDSDRAMMEQARADAQAAQAAADRATEAAERAAAAANEAADAASTAQMAMERQERMVQQTMRKGENGEPTGRPPFGIPHEGEPPRESGAEEETEHE